MNSFQFKKKLHSYKKNFFWGFNKKKEFKNLKNDKT